MNKQSFKNLVATCALVSVAFLAGCNSSGKAFDVDKIQNIEKGTTTKSDILEYFGEPIRREAGQYGEVWTYTHVDSRATAAGIFLFITIRANESKTVVNKLSVVFDSDDIVKDYHFSSSTRKDGYAPSR